VTRHLRWICLSILVLGAIAGGLIAWRSEAEAASAEGPARTEPSLQTPLLSVRRVPSLLAAPVAERRLLADLEGLTQTLPAGTCLAVAGADLTFGHRADEPMVPASTLKLLTATAALERLDPRSRFRTTAVATTAPAGDGVVTGDLTLVGGGDPLLATADYVARFPRQPQLYTDLDALAADVARSGVRRVTGSVVGDESRYDTVRYVAGWPSRYIDQGSIGPLSALSVNDGFASYATADDPGRPLEAAAQPAEDAASVFARLLEARGVEVVGDARTGAAPAAGVELAGLESPPLVEVVGQLLRESDNNTAELLLKELGHKSGSATTARGAAVVTAVSKEVGTAQVADGSGLSLDDRVTCQLLVDTLLRPGTGEVLQDELPVAGVSGTLADRFRGTDLEGVLRAKTGSLSSVAALAGIVKDDDPALAFALLVNAPASGFPDGVGDLQRQVAEALAAWPRVPDVTVLGPRVDDG
jgi:serine-type D-Ala-D-Ala carboxypeptidase/endopeptidase (penicillin-binding protein 4)